MTGNLLFNKVLVLLTDAFLCSPRASFCLTRQRESFLKQAVKASSGNLQGFVEAALSLRDYCGRSTLARWSAIKRHWAQDQRSAEDYRHLRTCVKAAGVLGRRWWNDRFYADPLKSGLITSHNQIEGARDRKLQTFRDCSRKEIVESEVMLKLTARYHILSLELLSDYLTKNCI